MTDTEILLERCRELCRLVLTGRSADAQKLAHDLAWELDNNRSDDARGD